MTTSPTLDEFKDVARDAEEQRCRVEAAGVVTLSEARSPQALAGWSWRA
jgi:hypothetical protein